MTEREKGTACPKCKQVEPCGNCRSDIAEAKESLMAEVEVGEDMLRRELFSRFKSRSDAQDWWAAK